MKHTLTLTGAAAVLALAATSATATSATSAIPAGSEMTASSLAGSRTRTASQANAAMTRDQRIGQLFMVATQADSVDSGLRSAIGNHHVGNVILMGRSTSGANHIRSVTTSIQRLTEPMSVSAGVPAFISADQEGGNVQVLRGPGYDTMPTALVQGQQPTLTLQGNAERWGTQLGRSGVNTNLAPVLDVVPASHKATNQPIGRWDREYGATTSVVTVKGGAVQTGMTRAGVATTVKHFPGLGRVVGNTDVTKGVTDSVTSRTSPILHPFAVAVDRDTPFVMMSSAIYTKIDARQPAVFSPTVIRSVLRTQLGFGGVIMTDDVGNAKQLEDWTPGQRATKFIDAGGDMVLTANTSTLPQMVAAVRSKAATSPAFATKVDIASLRVLRAKEAAGLLTARIAPDGQYTAWTTKRIQMWLGVPATGTFDTSTITAFQRRIGASATGRWDAASFRALQTYLGISADGTTTWNVRTTTQMQRYLITQL